MVIVGYNGDSVTFDHEGDLNGFINDVADWHVVNDDEFLEFTEIGMYDDDDNFWQLEASQLNRVNNKISLIVLEGMKQGEYEQQERDYLMTYPGRL